MLLVFERCESGAQSGNADRAAGDEEAGDVVEHVRIAECVADAKAGERICLRERPGHDHSSALVRETRLAMHTIMEEAALYRTHFGGERA